VPYYRTGFQEPSSNILLGIIEFNQHLLTLIAVIVTLVGWSLYYLLVNFSEVNYVSSRKFTHSKELEIVWTSVPALTLLVLAIPSFTLLYAMDEAVAPDMTVKIIGHQWFWCYEIDDFLQIKLCELQSLKRVLRYTSYMLVIEGIPGNNYPEGYLRLLETTKRILLPIKTFLRLLVTSSDVLHSWSIPSFGIKMDACPGRLNQINLFIEKTGSYYGACYEICGIQHGFMPIAIVAASKESLLHKFSSF
jgi:heme/copper-type cytochrome/quinol oxidase subunit 2